MSTSTLPIYQPALDRGLSIIPIPPREKGTKLADWPTKAKNDAAIMDGLDDHNYGVVANEQFCILDIDNLDAFYESIKVNLPLTYTVKTSRGRHLYFKHTDRSRRLGNRGAGIFDFQADRKYVVGEGSTHPSGQVYECINPLPIIEIPDALVDALDQYVSVRKERLRQAGEKCEDRQDMLNYAGTIYTTEITEEEMLEKLIERNEEYSEEPLSMGDLKRMVDYAFKKWEHAEAGPKAVFGSQEHKKLVLAPDAHVSGGSFDFMLGPWDGEKHGILGTRRLHIISGASGSGKSTLALQMLEAQAKGEPFLNRVSYGWPYLVIWQDRGQADLEEQLDNMGVLQNPPPHALLTPEQVALGPARAVEEIYLARAKKPKAVFVEGVDMWSDDASDMKRVGTLCSELLKVAEHYNLAVIFSAGSPKRKVKEGYLAVRDRVIGSSAWGRKTSTIIEVMEEHGPGNHRIITVLSRTARAQVVTMRMEKGRLKPTAIDVNITMGGEDMGSKREAIFSYLDARPDLTSEGLAKAFAPMALSTARNWKAEHKKKKSAGSAESADKPSALSQSADFPLC